MMILEYWLFVGILHVNIDKKDDKLFDSFYWTTQSILFHTYSYM